MGGGAALLTLCFGVPQDLEDFTIDGVLSQGPHDIPTLAVADLSVANPVEEQEGLLELCRANRRVMKDQH